MTAPMRPSSRTRGEHRLVTTMSDSTLQDCLLSLIVVTSRVDLEVSSAGGFSPDDHARVAAALAAVGLDASLAKRPIDQLSGGQMRRGVLAGLLARSPRVLILDEPLAGLDAASQRGLLRLLADRRRDTGLTVVVISH